MPIGTHQFYINYLGLHKPPHIQIKCWHVITKKDTKDAVL